MDEFGDKIIRIEQMTCRRMCKHGKINKLMVKLIERLSRHESWDVRNEVALTLAKIGSTRPNDSLRILASMSDDDPWVLETVGKTVGSIGGFNPPYALKILEKLAKNRSFWVRQNVINSTIKILRADPKIAIKILKEWAGDGDRCLREATAIILGKVNIDPLEKLSILKDLAKDDYNNVRRAALDSFFRLPHFGEIEVILRLSKDHHWGIRETVARLIARTGEVNSPELIMVLKELIYDGVGAVRRAAASSLGSLACQRPQVYLSTLKELVEDKAAVSPDVLKVMVDYLSRMGEDSMGLLMDLANDDDLEVKESAEKAINGLRVVKITEICLGGKEHGFRKNRCY